jgi:hypothetical protein
MYYSGCKLISGDDGVLNWVWILAGEGKGGGRSDGILHCVGGEGMMEWG